MATPVFQSSSYTSQSGRLATPAAVISLWKVSKSPSFDGQVGWLNDPHLVAIENVQLYLYMSAPSCWILAMKFYPIPLLVQPYSAEGKLKTSIHHSPFPTTCSTPRDIHSLIHPTSKQSATIHPSLPYWLFQKHPLCLYTQVMECSMGLSSILHVTVLTIAQL